jgi:Protein of unknown function (DUF1571)
MRRHWSLSAVFVVGVVGCFTPKKYDSPLLADLRESRDQISAPKPPAKPVLTETKVPKIDLAKQPRPAMPGLPGTASNPVTIKEREAPEGRDVFKVSAAVAEEEKTGPVRRLFKKIQEQREKNNKLPELPSALEKNEKPKEPPKTVPDDPKVQQAAATEKKATEKPKARTSDDVKAARALVTEAKKTFDATPDFIAKLTKRETVGGKKQPTEEMRFAFRAEPFSVHLTVTGDAGKGREVLYVKGQNNDKLTIVTGDGDNRLVGAGFKLTVAKDDPKATQRTRGKIDESGLGRPIRILGAFLDDVDAGKRDAGTIKSLGKVERKEFKKPVVGVEVTLSGTDDPLLPKGGKRTYYFDADEKSPSRHLPVLVITTDNKDEEVEYYLFTDFTLPAKLTDAEFDPATLGKKK